jgi:hypothetical protein
MKVYVGVEVSGQLHVPAALLSGTRWIWGRAVLWASLNADMRPGGPLSKSECGYEAGLSSEQVWMRIWGRAVLWASLNAVEKRIVLDPTRPCPSFSQPLYLLILCPQVKENVDKASPEVVGKPLFVGVLSDKQWHQLSALQNELREEYCMRREMLLKRLDVTIQSFQASTD